LSSLLETVFINGMLQEFRINLQGAGKNREPDGSETEGTFETFRHAVPSTTQGTLVSA